MQASVFDSSFTTKISAKVKQSIPCISGLRKQLPSGRPPGSPVDRRGKRSRRGGLVAAAGHANGRYPGYHRRPAASHGSRHRGVLDPRYEWSPQRNSIHSLRRTHANTCRSEGFAYSDNHRFHVDTAKSCPDRWSRLAGTLWQTAPFTCNLLLANEALE